MTAATRHRKRAAALAGGLPIAANPAKLYLTAMQLSERYGGRSEMWLQRTMKRNTDFPRPINIGRHRLWDLTEIEAYERNLAAKRGAA